MPKKPARPEKNPPVRKAKGTHDDKQYTENGKYNADYLVLLFQVGHSATTNIESNLAHTGSTLVFLHHLTEKEKGHAQGYNGCHGHKPEYTWNNHKIQVVIGIFLLYSSAM